MKTVILWHTINKSIRAMQFQDLRLTYADSVPQLGGRKPLNPSLKDGVVIRSLITLIVEYENADINYFTRCCHQVVVNIINPKMLITK